MDWSDILVKIGVGACLGFGIIVLAKLVKKSNKQGRRPGDPAKTTQDSSASDDTGRNKS